MLKYLYMSSFYVDVCNLEGIDPQNRDLVWEGQANCSLPQELGNYLQLSLMPDQPWCN